MKKLIIVTDLDGTLLDANTYSFEPAIPALHLLKEKDIPLIICSSKTRKEIEHYRKKLDNHHPFISENGGGIFIPKGYFEFKVQNSEFTVKDNENIISAKAGIQEDVDSRLRTAGMTEMRVFSGENDYYVISLGAKYSDLRKAIMELHEEGFKVKGFGDMSAEELADIANMNLDEVKMAKERDFDEPFIFEGDETQIQKLFAAIESKGFNYTQGRFFHILGNSDKGKAVSILIDMFKRKLSQIITIAIGDSPNDMPMLEIVDYPVIVQKPDGSYDERIRISGIRKASGIGPEGWNKAITELINS